MNNRRQGDGFFQFQVTFDDKNFFAARMIVHGVKSRPFQTLKEKSEPSPSFGQIVSFDEYAGNAGLTQWLPFNLMAANKTRQSYRLN